VKTTIEMARESWIDVYGLGHDRAKFIEALKHFESIVRADQREIDAKVCDAERTQAYAAEATFQPQGNPLLLRIAEGAMQCAAAIRAKGETK
jgi:hypothetical protein